MPAYTGPRGSGFTSLKQYLELNPEAAQRMGNDLVSDVNARGSAAEQGITSAAKTFGEKATAGTPTYEEVGTSAQAAARAAASVYGGPSALKDVADVDSLSRQAVDAQNRSKAIGTDAGRAALLGEKYGSNGGYTPGAAGLDAFLAGRGAGSRAEQAGSRWSGLRSSLGLAETSAAAQGAAGRTAAEDVARRYRERAGVLGQQETLAASQARLAADRAHRAGIQERDARAADRIGNTTTVNRDGTYAGTDSQVSPGRKGPKTDEDYNKRWRYP